MESGWISYSGLNSNNPIRLRHSYHIFSLWIIAIRRKTRVLTRNCKIWSARLFGLFAEIHNMNVSKHEVVFIVGTENSTRDIEDIHFQTFISIQFLKLGGDVNPARLFQHLYQISSTTTAVATTAYSSNLVNSILKVNAIDSVLYIGNRGEIVRYMNPALVSERSLYILMNTLWLWNISDSFTA